MKTLKRLVIGQVNELEKLSAREMGMIVGGYNSNPGNCFWNCMEYCSRKYEDKRRSYKKFAVGYEEGIGIWEGIGSKDQGVNQGPNYATLNSDGSYKLEQTPFDYLASQFKIEGSEWTKGSDVSAYFGSNRDKKCVIIGTFDTKGLKIQGSENEAHCAIFTGYIKETGEYSFIDPNDQGRVKYIREEYVLGAAKVTGKK